MKTIAIEGLCFAGKSTLAKGLLDYLGSGQCVILQDYSDLAKPSERPPVPAKTLTDELHAFRYYMQIDKCRWASIVSGNIKPPVAVQDRCFHTLLAHAYSNGKISKFDPLPQAEQFLHAQVDIIQPDIIFYLDASEDSLLNRYKIIQNSINSIFKNSQYMKYFQEYFRYNFIGDKNRVLFIDANKPATQVKQEVIRILKQLRLC